MPSSRPENSSPIAGVATVPTGMLPSRRGSSTGGPTSGCSTSGKSLLASAATSDPSTAPNPRSKTADRRIIQLLAERLGIDFVVFRRATDRPRSSVRASSTGGATSSTTSPSKIMMLKCTIRLINHGGVEEPACRTDRPGHHPPAASRAGRSIPASDSTRCKRARPPMDPCEGGIQPSAAAQFGITATRRLAAAQSRRTGTAIPSMRNRRHRQAVRIIDRRRHGRLSAASTCRVSSASFLSPSDSNKSMTFMTSPYANSLIGRQRNR